MFQDRVITVIRPSSTRHCSEAPELMTQMTRELTPRIWLDRSKTVATKSLHPFLPRIEGVHLVLSTFVVHKKWSAQSRAPPLATFCSSDIDSLLASKFPPIPNQQFKIDFLVQSWFITSHQVGWWSITNQKRAATHTWHSLPQAGPYPYVVASSTASFKCIKGIRCLEGYSWCGGEKKTPTFKLNHWTEKSARVWCRLANRLAFVHSDSCWCLWFW